MRNKYPTLNHSEYVNAFRTGTQDWKRSWSGVSRVFIAIAALGLWSTDANAYEQYHPSDATNTGDGCYQCHGWDNDANPTVGTSFDDALRFRNNGFDGRGPLHDLHVSQITGTCNLCHQSTGDVPFTYFSGDPEGQGCRGCHGVDNGSTVNWGAGLRAHHTNAGVPADIDGLTCADCHSDPAPSPESAVPVYYARSDVNAKDPCNADGTEDWGTSSPFDPATPDGLGLDNDGDLVYDGADSDCSTPPVPTPGDINFDGKADIIWRNSSSGQNWAYLMSGSAIDSSFGINTVADQAWQIVGNGDYDGDGDADLLWRNTSNGKNWMYLMQDGAISSSVSVNTVGDQAWQVVGNGDYDGDGDSDILWRNSSTGQNWLYLMNGSSIDSSVPLNTVADQNWQVVGNGDYDGDDDSDILWRNSSTGQNWMYLMQAGAINSSVSVNTVAGQAWQVAGSGDYDGDGNSDILWRNNSNGQNWMYLMNGASIFSSESVNTVLPTNWKIAGNGDYDGNGKADILWRNASTGQNWMYLMNGSAISASESVNTVAGGFWQIINVD